MEYRKIYKYGHAFISLILALEILRLYVNLISYIQIYSLDVILGVGLNVHRSNHITLEFHRLSRQPKNTENVVKLDFTLL